MKTYQVEIKIDQEKMKMIIIQEVEKENALEALNEVWWALVNSHRISVNEITIKLLHQ